MNSDLTRSMFPLLSRRTVLKSGFAAAAAAGLIPVRAHAASTVTFLGWQGYDDPITFDDFTKTKEITLNTDRPHLSGPG